MELLQKIQLIALFVMACALLLHYFRCINIPQTPLKKKKKHAVSDTSTPSSELLKIE
jgi:hypothetical protein